MKHFLLIFFLSINLNGQSDSTAIVHTQNNVKIESSNSENKYLTELDYYKLLSEQAKANNATHISLIKWTLGVSLAILIAIISGQIFFNYRINKKEIDFIKKDIDEKIASLKSSLIQNNETKFDDLRKQMEKKFTENSISSKKIIKDNLNTYKEYSKLKFEVVERSLKQEIKKIEKEVEKNAGDLWKLKGVESNALSSFLRSALLQIELNLEAKYIAKDINERHC